MCRPEKRYGVGWGRLDGKEETVGLLSGGINMAGQRLGSKTSNLGQGSEEGSEAVVEAMTSGEFWSPLQHWSILSTKPSLPTGASTAARAERWPLWASPFLGLDFNWLLGINQGSKAGDGDGCDERGCSKEGIKRKRGNTFIDGAESGQTPMPLPWRGLNTMTRMGRSRPISRCPPCVRRRRGSLSRSQTSQASSTIRNSTLSLEIATSDLLHGDFRNIRVKYSEPTTDDAAQTQDSSRCPSPRRSCSQSSHYEVSALSSSSLKSIRAAWPVKLAGDGRPPRLHGKPSLLPHEGSQTTGIDGGGEDVSVEQRERNSTPIVDLPNPATPKPPSPFQHMLANATHGKSNRIRVGYKKSFDLSEMKPISNSLISQKSIPPSVSLIKNTAPIELFKDPQVHLTLGADKNMAPKSPDEKELSADVGEASKNGCYRINVGGPGDSKKYVGRKIVSQTYARANFSSSESPSMHQTTESLTGSFKLDRKNNDSKTGMRSSWKDEFKLKKRTAKAFTPQTMVAQALREMRNHQRVQSQREASHVSYRSNKRLSVNCRNEKDKKIDDKKPVNTFHFTGKPHDPLPCGPRLSMSPLPPPCEENVGTWQGHRLEAISEASGEQDSFIASVINSLTSDFQRSEKKSAKPDRSASYTKLRFKEMTPRQEARRSDLTRKANQAKRLKSELAVTKLGYQPRSHTGPPDNGSRQRTGQQRRTRQSIWKSESKKKIDSRLPTPSVSCTSDSSRVSQQDTGLPLTKAARHHQLNRLDRTSNPSSPRSERPSSSQLKHGGQLKKDLTGQTGKRFTKSPVKTFKPSEKNTSNQKQAAGLDWKRDLDVHAANHKPIAPFSAKKTIHKSFAINDITNIQRKPYMTQSVTPESENRDRNCASQNKRLNSEDSFRTIADGKSGLASLHAGNIELATHSRQGKATLLLQKSSSFCAQSSIIVSLGSNSDIPDGMSSSMCPYNKREISEKKDNQVCTQMSETSCESFRLAEYTTWHKLPMNGFRGEKEGKKPKTSPQRVTGCRSPKQVRNNAQHKPRSPRPDRKCDGFLSTVNCCEKSSPVPFRHKSPSVQSTPSASRTQLVKCQLPIFCVSQEKIVVAGAKTDGAAFEKAGLSTESRISKPSLCSPCTCRLHGSDVRLCENRPVWQRITHQQYTMEELRRAGYPFFQDELCSGSTSAALHGIGVELGRRGKKCLASHTDHITKDRRASTNKEVNNFAKNQRNISLRNCSSKDLNDAKRFMFNSKKERPNPVGNKETKTANVSMGHRGKMKYHGDNKGFAMFESMAPTYFKLSAGDTQRTKESASKEQKATTKRELMNQIKSKIRETIRPPGAKSRKDQAATIVAGNTKSPSPTTRLSAQKSRRPSIGRRHPLAWANARCKSKCAEGKNNSWTVEDTKQVSLTAEDAPCQTHGPEISRQSSPANSKFHFGKLKNLIVSHDKVVLKMPSLRELFQDAPFKENEAEYQCRKQENPTQKQHNRTDCSKLLMKNNDNYGSCKAGIEQASRVPTQNTTRTMDDLKRTETPSAWQLSNIDLSPKMSANSMNTELKNYQQIINASSKPSFVSKNFISEEKLYTDKMNYTNKEENSISKTGLKSRELCANNINCIGIKDRARNSEPLTLSKNRDCRPQLQTLARGRQRLLRNSLSMQKTGAFTNARGQSRQGSPSGHLDEKCRGSVLNESKIVEEVNEPRDSIVSNRLDEVEKDKAVSSLKAHEVKKDKEMSTLKSHAKTKSTPFRRSTKQSILSTAKQVEPNEAKGRKFQTKHPPKLCKKLTIFSETDKCHLENDTNPSQTDTKKGKRNFKQHLPSFDLDACVMPLSQKVPLVKLANSEGADKSFPLQACRNSGMVVTCTQIDCPEETPYRKTKLAWCISPEKPKDIHTDRGGRKNLESNVRETCTSQNASKRASTAAAGTVTKGHIRGALWQSTDNKSSNSSTEANANRGAKEKANSSVEESKVTAEGQPAPLIPVEDSVDDGLGFNCCFLDLPEMTSEEAENYKLPDSLPKKIGCTDASDQSITMKEESTLTSRREDPGRFERNTERSVFHCHEPSSLVSEKGRQNTLDRKRETKPTASNGCLEGGICEPTDIQRVLAKQKPEVKSEFHPSESPGSMPDPAGGSDPSLGEMDTPVDEETSKSGLSNLAVAAVLDRPLEPPRGRGRANCETSGSRYTDINHKTSNSPLEHEKNDEEMTEVGVKILSCVDNADGNLAQYPQTTGQVNIVKNDNTEFKREQSKGTNNIARSKSHSQSQSWSLSRSHHSRSVEESAANTLERLTRRRLVSGRSHRRFGGSGTSPKPLQQTARCTVSDGKGSPRVTDASPDPEKQAAQSPGQASGEADKRDFRTKIWPRPQPLARAEDTGYVTSAAHHSSRQRGIPGQAHNQTSLTNN